MELIILLVSAVVCMGELDLSKSIKIEQEVSPIDLFLVRPSSLPKLPFPLHNPTIHIVTRKHAKIVLTTLFTTPAQTPKLLIIFLSTPIIVG